MTYDQARDMLLTDLKVAEASYANAFENALLKMTEAGTAADEVRLAIEMERKLQEISDGAVLLRHRLFIMAMAEGRGRRSNQTPSLTLAQPA